MNLFSVLVCRQVQSKCSCSFFPRTIGIWTLNIEINDRRLTFHYMVFNSSSSFCTRVSSSPFCYYLWFCSRVVHHLSSQIVARHDANGFRQLPPAHSNVNFAVFRLNNVTHSARSDRIDMLVSICKGSISRAGVGPASWAKRILELEKTMTRN